MRLAAAAAAVLALSAVVALASRAEVGGGAGREVHPGLPPAVLEWLVALGAVVGLAALSLYVLAFRSPRPRGDDDETAPPAHIHPALKLAAQLVAVVLILVVTFFVWGALERSGSTAPRPVNPPLSATANGHRRPGAPDVDPRKIAVVATIFLLIGAGLVVWLRPRRDETGKRSARRAVADAVEESLGSLADEPDPRRAVIAAYARMERALGASGIPRRAPEAPLEYMHRALRQLRAGARPVRRLTGLFAVAKFSQHPVDAGMKQDAISALEEVGRDLAAADEEAGA